MESKLFKVVKNVSGAIEPIRTAIPIRINPQKLTIAKWRVVRAKNESYVTMINDGTSARRFDFEKSGAYYGVLVDVFNNP
jgi:hypothetical protein